MGDLALDVQAGVIRLPEGAELPISTDEMAALYWAALSTPCEKAAAALGIEIAALTALHASLGAKLGIAPNMIGKVPLRLSNGFWPRSAVPWAERHAVTLIQRGLERPADDVLVVVAGEGTMTVGDVASIVARIRAGLDRDGIGLGAFVALDATQRVETFLLAMAVLLQGATIVRIGDNLPDDVMRDMLRANPVGKTFSVHMAAFANLPEAGDCIDLDTSDGGFAQFGDWVAGCPDTSPGPPAQVRPDTVALVGFTSGSTGKPKRILNSHLAVLRTSEVALHLFGFGKTDVFCSATDIVAMSGFRSMLTLPLMSGGKVLFLSAEARSNPLAQALECAEHGVTCLTAVPNVLRAFVKADHLLQVDDLAHLRLVLSGSGVLDVTTVQAFYGRFGVPVVDYFGKREIGTALYTSDDTATTLGTGGGSAAETLVRILDQQFEPLPVGQIGEMFVLTDCVSLPDPQQQGPTDIGAVQGPAGWHATGDLARVNVSGHIMICGRSSDAIKSPDGQLVLPIEIEDALGHHPSVAEACAFSVFRKNGVECVGASVVLKESMTGHNGAAENLLRRHVHDSLGPYKTPERILVLPDFPRVGRLKPDRSALKLAFLEMLDEGAPN